MRVDSLSLRKAALVVVLLTCGFFGLSLPVAAQSDETHWIELVVPDEAAQILATKDDYLEAMSLFDRASRYGTKKPLNDAERQAFYADKTLPWTDGDRERLEEAAEHLFPMLDALQLNLPMRIKIIKTNGQEEGGGNRPYTRMQSIIFSENFLNSVTDEALEWVLAHEVFHIFTRHNPRSRDRLYALVGFEAGPVLELPPVLRQRRITNPDAVENRHYFKADFQGETLTFIPVIYGNRVFDMQGEANFFDYLTLKMMAVEMNPLAARPVHRDGVPLLVDPEKLPDLPRITGGNTSYYIHPEEILADNFAIGALFLQAPNPELPRQLMLEMQAISNP